MLARLDRQRFTAGDPQAVPGQGGGLVGVVGEQAQAADAEVGEDLRAGRVVPGVGGQPQLGVGVQGVPAQLLQFVGPELGEQADAAPLVAAEVDDDAPAVLDDAVHGLLELRAAVAALRVEDVAGQALGVEPHQDVLAVAEVAVDEGDVLDAVDRGAVTVGGEVAGGGGQPDGGLAADGRLAAAAVGDQVLDGDDRQAVLAGEGDQFGQAQHGAVLARDLHDGPGGAQSGEPGEVDGGLGVAGPDQDSAGLGAQREDVAGADQVAGGGRRVGEQPQGGGAVGGGDAGGDAVGGAAVDRDGEGRLHGLGVGGDHLRQVEPVQVRSFQGRADQSAALAHHEGDDLGGGLLGGDDEVTLVLAVLVVHHDDGPAGGDVGDGLLDRVEDEPLLGRAGAVAVVASTHAGAPSSAAAVARERCHQSRMPHRTRAR
ncbi:GTP cyclohydrolase/3,4-dihydroxy-2-butanone 4-phosphate synthase bi-functional protein [Streptomyces sp. PVA_94-07]|nr:GTP cyclohydrolase/3,4-dihydroxy-2-butanone 4-phosphate synthase bi-functional protein [Streptomyces sp. PVA_94-07]